MPLKTEKTGQRDVLPIDLDAWRDAVSYRMHRPVVQMRVYSSGDVYPICPRCGQNLDREYMAFCDRCGQHLGWKIYPVTKIRRVPKQTDLPSLLMMQAKSQSKI